MSYTWDPEVETGQIFEPMFVLADELPTFPDTNNANALESAVAAHDLVIALRHISRRHTTSPSPFAMSLDVSNAKENVTTNYVFPTVKELNEEVKKAELVLIYNSSHAVVASSLPLNVQATPYAMYLSGPRMVPSSSSSPCSPTPPPVPNSTSPGPSPSPFSTPPPTLLRVPLTSQLPGDLGDHRYRRKGRSCGWDRLLVKAYEGEWMVGGELARLEALVGYELLLY
ncbi:hypothetical protein BDQ17DRAFT_1325662 [Cyathus striatus]|nr:hypothetical protein BDQ17DRAFT_1325662 [Cyathus striatus]